MIKINKLNKYFNRNKSNQIHVINDLTLELPEKGLVVLLGPSGSGKTTLLNVLGGLDKVQNGSMQFGDKVIDKYKSKVWDEIRNKDVGYIFQNYNLLTSLTVYDNIALTLNMVGVVDKDEIDKRIDYILENIGMINYRKRRAFQLSGGQQQRVAIARALAKNPKVIIADEPTGNLDSKNTLDIMNIIKKISQTKLVVLVTHEEELADFYADRVIKLIDGQVVEDYENTSQTDLDMKHDTDIYLKDLRELTNIEDNVANVKVYSDEDTEAVFNVKLIVKNKTLYLDIDSEDYKKVKLVNDDSEVKILDRHFEKVTKADFSKSTFDLENIISEDLTIEKRSVISFKESFKLAVNRLMGTTRLGKLFYLGFFGGAILIAIAVAMLSSVYYLNPANFLTGAKETVVIDYNNFEYSDLIAHEDESSINYVNLINGQSSMTMRLPTVFQVYDNSTEFTTNPAIVDFLDADDIILGDNVEDYNEMVIDKVTAELYLESQQFQNIGITTLNDLLNVDIILKLNGNGTTFDYIIDIVGISDTDNPVFFVKEETMYMIETGVAIYEVFEDDIVLSEGALPTDIDDIIAFDDPDQSLPMSAITIIELGNLFHVSALYTSTSAEIPDYLIALDVVKELYYEYNYIQLGTEIYVHSNDIKDTIKYFKTLDIDAYGLYKAESTQYKLERLERSVGTIVFTVVVLSAMSISYFFIIRSSLISRIYEVSVYRALGVTKGDIRKIFVTEIALITTVTSVVGYIVTSYILIRVQAIAADYYEFLHVSVFSFISGLVLIYLINILSGIVPVSNLLRKTPAEILSKYDF